MNMEPWARLPAETGAAYRAFLAYRDLGPGRTIDTAYAKWKYDSGETPRHQSATEAPSKRQWKATGTWNKWSRTHHWVLRSDAWDAHIQETEEKARIDAIRKAAFVREEEWEARRQVQRREEWDLSELLRTKARDMLKVLLVVKERTEVTEDGKTIKHIFKPAKWSMYTAVEMMKLASDLGRRAANMPPKVEEQPAQDLGEQMYETGGQLESDLPAGAFPPIPEDAAAKPDLASVRDASGGGKARKPKKERPDK